MPGYLDQYYCSVPTIKTGKEASGIQISSVDSDMLSLKETMNSQRISNPKDET